MSRYPCLLSLQLRLDAVVLNPFLLGSFAHCSNFEMIQMLKCTPNSNLIMEAEFENILEEKL